MVYYIKNQDLLDLLDENGRTILTAAKSTDLRESTFPQNCTLEIARGRRP